VCSLIGALHLVAGGPRPGHRLGKSRRCFQQVVQLDNNGNGVVFAVPPTSSIPRVPYDS
jgi:hypothetical protein